MAYIFCTVLYTNSVTYKVVNKILHAYAPTWSTTYSRHYSDTLIRIVYTQNLKISQAIPHHHVKAKNEKEVIKDDLPSKTHLVWRSGHSITPVLTTKQNIM